MSFISHLQQVTVRRAVLLCFHPPASAGRHGSGRRDWLQSQIRPLLSDKCFLCHGPDQGTRKGKFRLDLAESALEKKAIVPGQPEKSELVKRIFSQDPKEVMPPPETHKSLAPAEKELLRAWIAEGAKYEPHWSYVPPVKPEDSGRQQPGRLLHSAAA